MEIYLMAAGWILSSIHFEPNWANIAQVYNYSGRNLVYMVEEKERSMSAAPLP